MSRFTRSAVVRTLSASALARLPAMAADALNYNQISLRAEVSQEVAHDQMQVSLYSEAQDKDPVIGGLQLLQQIIDIPIRAKADMPLEICIGCRFLPIGKRRPQPKIRTEHRHPQLLVFCLHPLDESIAAINFR